MLPGSVVTSGTLTAGQWNYIPLPTPLQLSIGNVSGNGAAVYQAATGFTGSFPDTNNQFATGDPFASGITNGPLLGLFGPLRASAEPDRLIPGWFRRRGHRPVGEYAGPGFELLELLDRPPGQ